MCEVFEFVALDREDGGSGGSKIICGPIAVLARDESHALAQAGGIIREQNPDVDTGRLEVLVRPFLRSDDDRCQVLPINGA